MNFELWTLNEVKKGINIVFASYNTYASLKIIQASTHQRDGAVTQYTELFCYVYAFESYCHYAAYTHHYAMDLLFLIPLEDFHNLQEDFHLQIPACAWHHQFFGI